jgi:hypothetical protein
MCDYSLHAVASRPAKAGETLITTTFRGAGTRGFAAEARPEVAVCLLPGTELAFADAVGYDDDWGWKKSMNVRVARFRKVEPDVKYRHHDALEFPDGSTVLVTQLRKGQRATVLQLPIGAQVSERPPKAATPAEANKSAPVSAV